MQTQKTVSLTLMVPREIRNFLKRIAAERNIEDPDQNSSMSSVGVEILSDYHETLSNERGQGNGTTRG